MFRSFKAKPYALNLIITVGICLIVGMLIYYSASAILIRNIEDSLTEVAKQGAITVEKEIVGYLNVLETLANMDEIKDPKNPITRKLNILKAVVIGNNHRMSLIDIHGWGNITDNKRVYLGDRDYFKKALAGHSNVSDPLISRSNGNQVVVFAVPVFYNGHIVAILTATHEVSVLSNISDHIKPGKSGSSFLINSRGDIIAQSDLKMVIEQKNVIKNVKKNPRLNDLIHLEQLMIQGKTGAGEYEYQGKKNYLAFAPIKGTGWSLAVTEPKSQIFAKLNQIFFFLALMAFSFFFSAISINLYNVYLQRRLNKAITTSNNAIDTANIMIISFDMTGKIRNFNRYAEIKLGLEKDDVIGKKTIFDFIPSTHMKDFHALLHKINHETAAQNFEMPLKHSEDSLIYVLWNANLNKAEFHDVDIVEIMGIDITDRVKSEQELLASHEELTALYEQLASSNEELRYQYEQLNSTQEKLCFSEERYRLAQEGSNDVIWDWDIPNNTIYFSNKITLLLGYESEEVASPQLLNRFVHPDDQERLSDSMSSYLQREPSEFIIEFRIKTKEGSYKWIFARGMAVKDKTGKSTRMAGSFTDISDRKAKEEHIHRLAYYDSLTGLPNRTWLYENIAEYINNAKACHQKGALIFVDIDNFKQINDTFGHFLGDRILRQISERLRKTAGQANIVSRLSGDEFVVIIQAVSQKQRIDQYANQLMGVFHLPYEMDGHNFFITASAGITIFPDNGDSLEELLKNADLAMYQAKGEGKRRYVHYDASMKEALLEKTRLENSLRLAVQNNEFNLAFQPIISVHSGKVTGYEALLRWESPEFGAVSPAKFIKIAEENGLIVSIGQWVLKHAVTFAAELARIDPSLYVSVNISVIQLMQSDFVERVSETTREYSLPSQNLNLEITESLLMESLEENIGKLERLKKMGFGIFLDDFGTGYSSLNYLKRLPIDTVKIDKSFIQDIQFDDTEKNLIVSIISLAHLLGLEVVAEGVETQEQFNFLARHHCDLIQGYLISKPIKRPDALAFLEKSNHPGAGAKTGTGPDI